MNDLRRQQLINNLAKALSWITDHPSWQSNRVNIRRLAIRFEVNAKTLEAAINMRAQQ